MALYRKTALVEAEQFLPAENKIPSGVYSNGMGNPQTHPLFDWCLMTLEGEHTLRGGDYICTGPAGERWNVAREIFEATYELVASTPAVAVPVSEERSVLQSIHEGYQVNHSSKWVHRVVSEALAVSDKGVGGDQGSSGGLGQPGSGSQPGAAFGATAALARGPDDCWSVSVTFNGENILTIEQGVNYGSLSGIPDIEEFGDIVRDAALHLRSFIGSGGLNPCFLCGETEGCECWSQDTQLEPRDGATASTTSASGNEQVAAVVEDRGSREEIDPSSPASTVRGA